MKNSHLLLISPGLTALHQDIGAFLAPGGTGPTQARVRGQTQVNVRVQTPVQAQPAVQLQGLPQAGRQTQATPRPSLDSAVLNAYMLRGRQLRSQALHQALRRLAGGFRKGAAYVAAALRRVVRAIHAGQQRRAALRELRALNDHTLRDIGLSRAEIRTAIDELFRLRRHESDLVPEPRLPLIQELGHVWGKVDSGAAAACNDPIPTKAAEA